MTYSLRLDGNIWYYLNEKLYSKAREVQTSCRDAPQVERAHMNRFSQAPCVGFKWFSFDTFALLNRVSALR